MLKIADINQNRYFCSSFCMIDYTPLFKAYVKGELDEFYDVMYPGLLLFAAKTLGDSLSYMAEDCVQDVIVHTYINRMRFESALHWRRHLLLAIYHRAMKMVRHKNVCDSNITAVSEEKLCRDISYQLIKQETLDTLYAAIETLPQEYREIFDLSFEQGLRNPEIAAMLNIAQITVKKRKAKMIEMLRRKLGDISADDLIIILLAAKIGGGVNRLTVR